MTKNYAEWREALGDNAMRMPWWRELKWMIAGYVLGWLLRLIQEEMTNDTALKFAIFAASLASGNDPKFNTVKMQPIRH